MSVIIEPLVRDMLEWLGSSGRPYGEVMEAWRTNCPRLTVWEEANDRGFVHNAVAEGQQMVFVTPAGSAFLATRS